jgi:2,3-bisphosphoglycerate-independent phosphoglycerate mutase
MRPTVLAILDGWGIAPPGPGNAAALAKTPTLDRWKKTYAWTTLQASGTAVGLAEHQDGNSEAGHMNIGAGRMVPQEGMRISQSISNGTFFRNPAFLAAVHHVRKHNSTLHIMGLLGNNQSAHSDPDHLLALLMLAQNNRLQRVKLHLFTDGRDSPRYLAKEILSRLQPFLGDAQVATIMGRYYGMDRNKNWDRTELAYNTIVCGEGMHRVPDAMTALTQAYNRGESDEFVTPTVVGNYTGMEDHDAIIHFNLRSDRARQLTKTFVQDHFEEKNAATKPFHRKKVIRGLTYAAMTEFGPDLDSILTAFPAIQLQQTLPMVLHDIKQLYIAESEKYAHVTYFFNGGYADPVGNEDRVMIPSPDVPFYDQTPAMSSGPLTDRVIADLQAGTHEFIVMNYANTDMIAHTGNLKAGIAAMEATDACLARLEAAVLEKNGRLLVSADHGNIEEMLNDATGEVDTEHSTNPVPLYLIDTEHQQTPLRTNGILGDIAPTILQLLGRQQPHEMSGQSLLSV